MTDHTTAPIDDDGGTPDRLDASLDGFRVGVTAHRRSKDLIEALQRRGATVLHAPALRIAPMVEDEGLVADTRAIIAARPDMLVATTAYGIRRWCEGADAAGLGEDLLDVLQSCKIFVRGPKARGAVRAAGLHDAAISSDETTATLVDMMLTEDLNGLTVAVQLHGFVDEDALTRLREAGARVLTVAPYRWADPEPAAESGPSGGAQRLPALIEAVCNQELDAVVFTSAPAVEAVFAAAEELGLGAAFREALAGPVATAAVGPVTAAPLIAAGITPLVPQRFRMGALVRLVCEHLARNHVQSLGTEAGTVEMRGRSLRIDGAPVPLAPAPLLLMRALLGAGGNVLSRQDLTGLLDLDGSAHALDMTVSRLRSALPDGSVVETVVKRGYRLRARMRTHVAP
ncbi:uroporphyrinogen-III synthase [Arthrobacter sp. 35W]|uniref:uroporphyrinogen-III synthase n=1 Tax=Arthrobacter sp. 35W TaxID=1132441 RepID=UPI0004263F21|nr:uroporphyrinogen-III synthase [Arthrobacter sp. 35W]